MQDVFIYCYGITSTQNLYSVSTHIYKQYHQCLTNELSQKTHLQCHSMNLKVDVGYSTDSLRLDPMSRCIKSVISWYRWWLLKPQTLPRWYTKIIKFDHSSNHSRRRSRLRTAAQQSAIENKVILPFCNLLDTFWSPKKRKNDLWQ